MPRLRMEARGTQLMRAAVVPQEVASVLVILRMKLWVELEPAKAEAQRERAPAQLPGAGREPVQAEEADLGQVHFRELRFKVASRAEAIHQLSPSRSSLRMA
jgi:hypothetical protein